MLRDLRSRWQSRVVASDLTDGAKVKLCALRDFLDRDGRAWPSYATLAAKTRRDRRSTIRHIREAERAGLLKVERLPRANVYQAVIAEEGAGTSTVATDVSPEVVTAESPVMVTNQYIDGDTRCQKLVSPVSPEISKRNNQRNGEPRSALQGAARSPHPTSNLSARVGAVAARIQQRLEARAAGAKP